MSWQAEGFRRALRWVEKPYLARVAEPKDIRQSFERRARLFFQPPGGVPVAADAIAGIDVLVIGSDAPDRPLTLYLHGGGYVFGSPETHTGLAAALARRIGGQVIVPRYRLAPEHPFPAGFDDARAVCEALAARARPLVLAGDSAGGGLALAVLADHLATDAPPLAGLVAFSPLTDLSFSSASFRDNADRDDLLPAVRAAELAAMYLGDTDPRDPRVSPLFADFTGAPPIWLAVGQTEILRDDTLALAQKLRAVGVDVTVEDGGPLPHVWPFFWRYLPEGRDTLDRVGAWIRARAAQGTGTVSR